MIVVLFAICGFAGAAAGLILGGAWFGAAAVFGFNPPTPDQQSGLIILGGTGGALGSAALVTLAFVWDALTHS